MKTYEQFREELLERLDNDRNEGVLIGITHAKIEELAAKEYAKQWIDRAVEDAEISWGDGMHGSVIDSESILKLKKEIDAQ